MRQQSEKHEKTSNTCDNEVEKRLRLHLKRKKLWMHVMNNMWNHMTVILVFMNLVKKSATQRMNMRAQQRIPPRKYPQVL